MARHSSLGDRLPSDWPEVLNSCRDLPYGDCFLDGRIKKNAEHGDPKKPGLKYPDLLSLCLRDDTVESREWRQVYEFCRTVKYREVLRPTTGRQKAKLIKGLVRGAWVDEKLIGPWGVIPVVRGGDLEKPLTPYGLYESLKRSTPLSLAKKSQYGPHGRRRLVYIRDLHEKPEYIVSILFPASELENSALRRILVRHIKCEPTLKVTIAERGQVRFMMQFNLPCYRLLFKDDLIEETEYVREVSFLRLQPRKRTYLRRCQMTMVMSGNSSSNYTVYGLFSGVDDDPLESKGGDEEDGDEGDFDEDYIAGHAIDEYIDPTIDPRMYFLIRFKGRLVHCSTLWGTFADYLSKAFTQHVKRTQRRAPAHCQDETKDLFDWVGKMIILLDEAVDSLSATYDQWTSFLDDGRDQYFMEEGMRKNLSAIHDEFRELDRILRQQLHKLRRDCDVYNSRVLKVDMRLKSAEDFQKSGIMATFTFKILSPLLVTLALFSMESSVIPFKKPKFIYVPCVFVGLAALVYLGEWISLPVARFTKSMFKTSLREEMGADMPSGEEDICNDRGVYGIDDDDDDGLDRADTLVGSDAVGITDVSSQV